MKRTLGQALGGVALALAWVVLATPEARPQTTELDIPVMVQTVPELPGARFSLDGRGFTADEHGLALITVDAPGTYRLEAPATFQPATHEPGGDRSARFALWSDGTESPGLDVTVDSFTHIEAGFDISYPVTPSVVGSDGDPLDGLDSVTVSDADGTETTWDGGAPLSLEGSRAGITSEGLSSDEVTYGVERIVVGNGTIPGPPGSFSPEDPGWTIEVASPGGGARPPDPASRAPIGIAAIAAIAAAAAAAAVLLGAAVAAVIRRRRAAPGHPPLEAPATRPGATLVPDGRASSAVGEDREHLRVHLIGGRVVEGWRETGSAPDERVLVLNLVRVFDKDGEEVSSTPTDSFLVTSLIAGVERVDEGYGTRPGLKRRPPAPPSIDEPSPPASTLEEPVTIDLRESSVVPAPTAANGHREVP